MVEMTGYVAAALALGLAPSAPAYDECVRFSMIFSAFCITVRSRCLRSYSAICRATIVVELDLDHTFWWGCGRLHQDGLVTLPRLSKPSFRVALPWSLSAGALDRKGFRQLNV